MGEKIKAKSMVMEISTVSLVKDGIIEGEVDTERNSRVLIRTKYELGPKLWR